MRQTCHERRYTPAHRPASGSDAEIGAAWQVEASGSNINVGSQGVGLTAGQIGIGRYPPRAVDLSRCRERRLSGRLSSSTPTCLSVRCRIGQGPFELLSQVLRYGYCCCEGSWSAKSPRPMRRSAAQDDVASGERRTGAGILRALILHRTWFLARCMMPSWFG
jgi:hypothetical protein